MCELTHPPSTYPSHPHLPEPKLLCLMPLRPHTCSSRLSSSVMGAMLVQATLASAAAALAAFTCACSCFTCEQQHQGGAEEDCEAAAVETAAKEAEEEAKKHVDKQSDAFLLSPASTLGPPCIYASLMSFHSPPKPLRSLSPAPHLQLPPLPSSPLHLRLHLHLLPFLSHPTTALPAPPAAAAMPSSSPPHPLAPPPAFPPPSRSALTPPAALEQPTCPSHTYAQLRPASGAGLRACG